MKSHLHQNPNKTAAWTPGRVLGFKKLKQMWASTTSPVIQEREVQQIPAPNYHPLHIGANWATQTLDAASYKGKVGSLSPDHTLVSTSALEASYGSKLDYYNRVIMRMQKAMEEKDTYTIQDCLNLLGSQNNGRVGPGGIFPSQTAVLYNEACEQEKEAKRNSIAESNQYANTILIKTMGEPLTVDVQSFATSLAAASSQVAQVWSAPQFFEVPDPETERAGFYIPNWISMPTLLNLPEIETMPLPVFASMTTTNPSHD
jgi:hypothetical protein